MSLTVPSQNADDLRIINSFLETVSWGNELTLCQSLDGDSLYLVSLDPFKRSDFLLRPCVVQRYETAVKQAIAISEMHGVKPGLIIDGACDDARFDYIQHDASIKALVLYWHDVHNKIRYSSFLHKALDGVDWGRTFYRAMQNSGSPIYEWDI